jgi:hypothetical protein
VCCQGVIIPLLHPTSFLPLPGRERVRVRVAQNCYNLFQNSLEIGKDFIVPKSENPIASGNQKFRSTLVIVYSLGVLSSVKLNNEPFFRAAKINDEGSDEMLTAKLYFI